LGTYIILFGILFLGIWIIVDEAILKKSPFKKFFLVLIALLPIFSFPVLEDSTLNVSKY